MKLVPSPLCQDTHRVNEGLFIVRYSALRKGWSLSEMILKLKLPVRILIC